MTDQEINVAIAEWCGWRDVHNNYNHAEFYPGGIVAGKFGNKEYVQAIPSYTTDLNAVHEAEKNLREHDQVAYYYTLVDIALRHKDQLSLVCATARQRCEALLRTIGKWKD